jgi:hypothetical protein
MTERLDPILKCERVAVVEGRRYVRRQYSKGTVTYHDQESRERLNIYRDRETVARIRNVLGVAR